jgi:hypothetical protein
MLSALAGTCAITFNSDQYQYSPALWPNVTGNIGTAIFPGSPRVLARATNTLEPCTKELCPLAATSSRTKQLVNFAPLYTVYRNRYILADTATGDARAAVTGFFQFLAAGSTSKYIIPLLTALGLQKPAAMPGAAITMHDPSTNTSGPGNTSAPTSTDTNSTAPPLPTSPQYGFNMQPLVDAGFNPDDTLSFLPAFVSAAFHRNQLQDLAIPGAAYFR